MRLAEPLLIELDEGAAVLVPEGFWSDGASVPSWAWPLLEASPVRLMVMGIAHDYAVCRGAKIQRPGVAEDFQVESATEFATAVAAYYGVSGLDQGKIKLALRAAAWSYWQRRDVLWTPAAA